ncbi:MAG: hypothetical protein DYH12_17860 [Sorangiineae bacterium PRO1]|nr:hypothetical protein [Sorangiineae bacterium PRO1]
MITSYTDDKIRYLRRIHGVLAEDVAAEEARIEANSRWSGTCDPSEVDEVFDRVLDPLAVLYGRVQSLGHQLVVVGLASLIENTIRLLLEKKGVSTAGLRGFDRLTQAFNANWPQRLPTATAFPHADLVRVLANDFKHNNGVAKDQGPTWKVVQRHRGVLGTDFVWERHVVQGKIDFGSLPVERYIDQIEAFLNEIQSW